jgi:hypothetical protein
MFRGRCCAPDDGTQHIGHLVALNTGLGCREQNTLAVVATRAGRLRQMLFRFLGHHAAGPHVAQHQPTGMAHDARSRRHRHGAGKVTLYFKIFWHRPESPFAGCGHGRRESIYARKKLPVARRHRPTRVIAVVDRLWGLVYRDGRSQPRRRCCQRRKGPIDGPRPETRRLKSARRFFERSDGRGPRAPGSRRRATFRSRKAVTRLFHLMECCTKCPQNVARGRP